jgi:hypothetical protein
MLEPSSCCRQNGSALYSVQASQRGLEQAASSAEGTSAPRSQPAGITCETAQTCYSGCSLHESCGQALLRAKKYFSLRSKLTLRAFMSGKFECYFGLFIKACDVVAMLLRDDATHLNRLKQTT